MNITPLISLVYNAALLLTLSLVYDALPLRPKSDTRRREVVIGVAVGIIGVAVMLSPWRAFQGVHVDTRVILLGVVGLYFGFIPALVATVMTAMLRLFHGGPGMVPGIATILLSAGLGLAWKRARPTTWKTFGKLELYVFGLIVTGCHLLFLPLLPPDLLWPTFPITLVSQFIVLPASTVLLGQILTWQQTRKETGDLIRESERRFRKMIEQGWDIVSLLDARGEMRQTSESVRRTLGIAPSEVDGRSPGSLVRPDDAPRVKEAIATVQETAGATATIESRVQHRDGRQLWIEIALTNLLSDPDVNAIVMNARDITERKRALERVGKLNRILTVLSNINQAIVRIKDIEKLLFEACQIAIRDGKLHAAWIALIEPETGRLKPAASAGVPIESVDALLVAADPFSADSGHPVALALSTGTAQVCNDISNAPSLYARHDGTGCHGCLAVAAFPIKVFGRVEGVLNLCSSEENFFDTEEVRILDELTTDLAFAMEYAEQERQRMAAEKERQSIEWMLDRAPMEAFEHQVPGDLMELNRSRLILNLVGESILRDIMADFIGLLDSCATVYEANGDYALSIVSSDWCRELHAASRRICAESEERGAQKNTNWHCHESCWTDTARVAIQTSSLVDKPCLGGLHLYAVPILAGDEVVGSICIAYGNPPKDPARITEISDLFHVPEKRLAVHAESYLARPPFIIEEAKRRLGRAARLIGEIIVRKQAEEALKESETRYRSLFEDSLAVMMLIEPETGAIIDANPAAATYYGWSREAMSQMFIQDVNTLPPEKVREEVESARQECRNQFLFTHRKADGSVSDVEVFSGPIQIHGNTCLYSIVHDITERRLAERERDRNEVRLRQAQKMEAIGRLAGGVAHDFNNMLNVILGYTDMALRDIPRDESLYQDLNEVRKAGEHAADLVRQLLAFSRKQVMEPKVMNLRETVRNRLKMLRRLMGEEIEVSVSIPGSLWNILIDPSQMDQILINLAANARDAIEGVGTVNIEAQNVTLDQSYTYRDVAVTPGDYVMLAVSDTGVGMDSDTVERIFEPFFTTKKSGQGTGLGLATVYGIVEQVGGRIHTYSEPGHGTTFKIYFPRFQGEAHGEKADTLKGNGRGNETVLVVEDEHQILDLIDRILRLHGYTVLKASTPDEAVLLAETHSGEIHLLLTDVVMPAMNGKDLQARVREWRPGLKTLFMSGYTANVIAHRGVLEQDVAFLPKPFSVELLTRKVRQTLDTGKKRPARSLS